MTLDRDDIEALAVRVAELLEQRGAQSAAGLVDAAEIARRFGTDRAWVYSHAAELGAVRLGDGPKARLRFDPQVVLERMQDRGHSKKRRTPSKAPRKRQRSRTAFGGPQLLPIKGSRIGS